VLVGLGSQAAITKREREREEGQGRGYWKNIGIPFRRNT
jgi:hypothetical protein